MIKQDTQGYEFKYAFLSRNACFIIKLIFWQIHRFRILVTVFASVTQSAIQAFKN